MFNRYRIFAAYVLAVPLAVVLGILSTSPDELTYMLVGLLMFFLALPLLIKWHHSLLVVLWNCAFVAFFLPGQPEFWMVLTALSFGLSALNYIIWRRPFLSVPAMTRPLLFLAGVVLVTAFYRGGIGLKVLGGGSHGGRQYIMILCAIVGYFAFAAVPIPYAKSKTYVSLFFLFQATSALSNLAFTLGPAFYFIYYLVPVGATGMQAASDYGVTPIDRIAGLAQASIGVLCLLLTVYGIRGILNLGRPWRVVLLILTLLAGFLAGYRWMAALLLLIVAFQFYFEGLFRSRVFVVAAACAVVALVAMVFLGDRMPLSVQRALSFLPENVVTLNSEVREDAAGSSDWRFQMWSAVWRDVPKYLLVGKGYTFDPTEMDLTLDAIRAGILPSFEEAMLAGNYHSGPLSVIVPFGILGAVAFLWVLWAGFRVLYLNYKYGDERLRKLNTVLLSYYVAYCISFFATFGALSFQLYVFLGTIGLSVSLNRGVSPKPRTFTEEPRILARSFAIEAR
jgi:hypothetical protein